MEPGGRGLHDQAAPAQRTPGPELDHVLRLQVTWSVDDIVAAIEHAAKYDAFAARAVERILEANDERTVGRGFFVVTASRQRQ